MVIKSFDGHHGHRAPALRVIGVQRNAVAQVVQRNRQVGDSRALLLVHRPAHRPGLRCRARYIQEQQHRQIAPAAQAVEVHRFVGHRAGTHLDARFDGGVDVDVVALRLAVAAVQSHSKSR